MIIRILGDGQYDLPDSHSEAFDVLDDALVRHVEAGDDKAYHDDLAALIDLVTSKGTELSHDEFSPSDLVLPDPLMTVEEVRELLAEEGQLSS
ncbi:MAG: PspA-associated protein PspAA [Actinomycetota bacterium]